MPEERPKSDVTVRLLGYDNNFAVIQLLAFLAMLWYAIRWHQGQALVAAAVVTFTGVAMLRTSMNRMAVQFLALAVLYSAFLYFSSIIWRIQVNLWWMPFELFLLMFSPWKFLIIISGIACIPSVQAIRIGTLGIGNLKGDFHIEAFGSRVPIALTSSIVLVSLLLTLYELTNFGRWWSQATM